MLHSGVEVVSTTFRPERARYGEGAAAAAGANNNNGECPEGDFNVKLSSHLKNLFKEEAKARASGSKLQGGNAPKSSSDRSRSGSFAASRRRRFVFEFFSERVGVVRARVYAQESYRDSVRSKTDYAGDNYAGEDV